MFMRSRVFTDFSSKEEECANYLAGGGLFLRSPGKHGFTFYAL